MLTFGLAKLLALGALVGLTGLAIDRSPARQAEPSFETAAVVMQDGRRLAVSRYEVSWTEWKTCKDDGGCSYLPQSPRGEKEALPVTGVNRFDVDEYIGWINLRDGSNWRLPTAAEWNELASELPRRKTRKLFDDPRLAWAADYGAMVRVSPTLRPQGNFGTFSNGVSDLGGNVWEWTSTCAPGGSGNVQNDRCPALIVEGLHDAVISVFVRDPATGGCATGTPPPHVGFRLVKDL